MNRLAWPMLALAMIVGADTAVAAPMGAGAGSQPAAWAQRGKGWRGGYRPRGYAPAKPRYGTMRAPARPAYAPRRPMPAPVQPIEPPGGPRY